ncbi:MAG: DUF488 domain-containing protein [Sphingomonas sp.]
MSERIPEDKIRLKRAYDPPNHGDGLRILVDRLWPRGVTKAKAGIDEWIKDIAPTTALRQWFGHDPARWDSFRDRYRAELAGHADILVRLRHLAKQAPITLVYSARDEVHNDAVVLRDVLLNREVPLARDVANADSLAALQHMGGSDGV